MCHSVLTLHDNVRLKKQKQAINTNAEVAPWLQKVGVRWNNADMIKVSAHLSERDDEY